VETPVRVIRWPGAREPLLDAEVQAARDSIEAGFAPVREQAPELVERILTATLAPHMLPEVRPALGELLLDDAGRLWVSRFAPTTEPWDQQHMWHVLDATGRPLARLTLPEGTRLVAVSRDRLAVVRRDELDVEHVEVYAWH